MDESMSQEMPKCQLCPNIGSLACSSCRQAFYCSAQHQKEDWKNHRSSCVCFKIVQDENVSPSFHAVATRALNPGSIILDEEPLFVMYQGPACYCITCGSDMSVDADAFSPGTGIGGKRCTKCHWPVCGDDCEKLPLHAENECKIFKENNILFNPYSNNEPCERTVKYVALARALCLKKRDPERWTKLMNVLSGPQPQQQPGQVVTDNNNVGSSFLALNLPDDITQGADGEWLQTFFKLAEVHGLFLQMREDIENEEDQSTLVRRSVYIFEKTSQFAHSCSANVDWMMGHFPDFKIRIRAAVPIKKGDRLCLNRLVCVERNPGIYGTEIRQQTFLQRYGCPCRCDLCLDPTEFGSFQSALVCPSCKPDCLQRHRQRPAAVASSTSPRFGYLVPQDPLKVPATPTSLFFQPSPSSSSENDMEIDQKDENDPLWECTECGHVIKFSQVTPQLVEAEEKLGLKWDHEKKGLVGGSSVPKLLFTFKKFKEEQVLHPNHWLFQKAARHLHHVCGSMSKEIDLNVFDMESGVIWNTSTEREKWLLFLLQVINKTMPGLHRYRVTLLRALSGQIDQRCDTINEKPLSRHKLKILQKAEEDLKLCAAMRKEVVAYYKTLPLPRGHVGSEPAWSFKHVKNDLEYTQSFIETVQEELQRRGAM